MGSNKGVDFTDVQSGNWNVAKPYTSEKILKWLVNIDIYQTIAEFGTHELINDITMENDNLRNFARTKALRRWIHAMTTLLNNTKFAIKSKDQSSFEEHLKKLKIIKNSLPKIESIIKKGSRVDTFKIKEKLFNKVADDLNKIMDEINDKLNRANLIFTYTEEFDYKKVKDNYKEEFSTSG